MKKILTLAFAVTILSTFSGNYLYAQTKEEASAAFNAARELSKTDMANAVIKMQDVLKMCSTVGKEADSLKMKVVKVLPAYQFNAGNDLMKAKKYDLAIPSFEKSLSFSVAYADANIKKMSEDQLVKLYFSKSKTLLKAEKADSAILFLDKTLQLDPENCNALYFKGLAYKKKGDNVKMVENMELSIASATKTNDTVILKSSKVAIGSFLNSEGIAAFNKKLYNEAITNLNNALGYGFKNKDLYYVLSSSYNSLKKYDEAIESANAGISLEEQTDLKLARYYCEIAKAYEGKKDNVNACTYFKKSVFGSSAAYSNDRIKNVLKCQ